MTYLKHVIDEIELTLILTSVLFIVASLMVLSVTVIAS